jgi:hypothetical protein
MIVDAHTEREAREMADARLAGPIIEFRLATDEEVQLWDFHNEMTAGQAGLTFRPGQRIRLLEMVDDPDPLPVGSLGTITDVRNIGDWLQIDVDWDNGRSLMLSVPPDRVEVFG